MSYTITKTETIDHRFSPETQYALMLFKKVMSVEKRAMKLDAQLQEAMLRIPDADFSHYVAITTEWTKDED